MLLSRKIMAAAGPFSARVIAGALVLGLLLPSGTTGCSSRPMRVLNADDGTAVLSADRNGVRVTGGGSASRRGWDRRVILSFKINNNRKTPLTLAREDLILRLGVRRTAAHQMIGSEETGPVEKIKLPPAKEVSVIAQFSTAFAIRKSGSVTLRLREPKEDHEVKLEMPLELRDARIP